MKSASLIKDDKSVASGPNSITSPRYPAAGTQPARLLADLLAYHRVDPLDGWSRLGIYRLSDTVLQLRKSGWRIVTSRKGVQNRFGESCRVAEYYLPIEDVDAAGERGRVFMYEAMEPGR